MKNPNPNPKGKKKNNILRNILIVVAVLAFTGLSFLAYLRPELYRAAITGGTTENVDVDIYISDGYQAKTGDSGQITVKAGKSLTNLRALEAKFIFDPSEIEITDVTTSGTALEGVYVDIPPERNETPGEFFVGFGNIGGGHLFTPIANITDNTVLFKISVDIAQGLSIGNEIVINYDEEESYIISDPDGFRRASFSSGKITVIDPCTGVTCGTNADCSEGSCQCLEGYIGNPDDSCYRPQLNIAGPSPIYLGDTETYTITATDDEGQELILDFDLIDITIIGDALDTIANKQQETLRSVTFDYTPGTTESVILRVNYIHMGDFIFNSPNGEGGDIELQDVDRVDDAQFLNGDEDSDVQLPDDDVQLPDSDLNLENEEVKDINEQLLDEPWHPPEEQYMFKDTVQKIVSILSENAYAVADPVYYELEVEVLEPDSDGDGVPDSSDICPGGDDNIDTDTDGTPDYCDTCPNDAENDADSDGVCGDVDICPGGDDNIDTDTDGTPDYCDNCPLDENPEQEDFDGDGVGDACGYEPSDIFDLLRIIINNTQVEGAEFNFYDVNGDGEINSSDIFAMLRIINQ